MQKSLINMPVFLQSNLSDLNSFCARGYTFLEVIGQGSFSKVWKVIFHDPVTQQRVLLAGKHVNKKKMDPQTLLKFLPRELYFCSTLSHLRLAQIHSVLQSPNDVFIFMRYEQNGDLGNYVQKRGPLQESQANLWFYQLADAIRYLHTLSVAHRDIKSENILISQDFNIVLSDFGFSRICIDYYKNQTYSTTYCGSITYSAPEVLIAKPYKPMPADIWSMGVVLSFMVFGILPFSGTNYAQFIRSQQEKRFCIKPEIIEILSSGCLEVLNKCFIFSADSRPTVFDLFQLPWLEKA